MNLGLIGKKKGIGLKSQLEEAIASLPHVDYKISNRMLKHFGSIKEIMNAKLEDFFEIQGVGEKIASDIIEFIYTDYNEIETGEETKGMKDELDFLKREKVKKDSKKSENEGNQ